MGDIQIGQMKANLGNWVVVGRDLSKVNARF